MRHVKNTTRLLQTNVYICNTPPHYRDVIILTDCAIAYGKQFFQLFLTASRIYCLYFSDSILRRNFQNVAGPLTCHFIEWNRLHFFSVTKFTTNSMIYCIRLDNFFYYVNFKRKIWTWTRIRTRSCRYLVWRSGDLETWVRIPVQVHTFLLKFR